MKGLLKIVTIHTEGHMDSTSSSCQKFVTQNQSRLHYCRICGLKNLKWLIHQRITINLMVISLVCVELFQSQQTDTVISGATLLLWLEAS